MSRQQDKTRENVLNAARESYGAFMAERITDDQQFGHKVEYPRSTLYEKIVDFLGKQALFGLFLAGFRAGQAFEQIQPEGALRSVNLNVDLIEAADSFGAREKNGLLVFNRTSLRHFANRVLQKALGQPVCLTVVANETDVPPSVDMVVEARLADITSLLRADPVVVPDARREALAYHLWTFDQHRTHGEIIGKWEHVGEQYKRQLEAQAETLLKLAFAVDHSL